jgi:undecaprenyl-diphosphatase
VTTPEHQGASGELRDDRFVGRQDLTHWYTPFGRALAELVSGVGRRIGAHGALVATLAIGALTLALASFLVARVYDSVTEHDGVASLDVPVLHAAMTIRGPVVNELCAIVAVVFGKVGMPVLALVVALALVLVRRSWTPLILIAAAGIGSLLMTIAGKDIIGRHRPLRIDALPPFESSPSFPSGHTLNAAVIVGIVAYLLVLRRRTAIARVLIVAAAVVLVAVVGITRVVLAAHWFTDVLAGWLLGAAWLAVVITAHRLYLTARHRGAPPGVAARPTAVVDRRR